MTVYLDGNSVTTTGRKLPSRKTFEEVSAQLLPGESLVIVFDKGNWLQASLVPDKGEFQSVMAWATNHPLDYLEFNFYAVS